MPRSRSRIALALAFCGMLWNDARAADVPSPDWVGSLFGWEIRGGLFAHDPFSPEHGPVDLNGEILAPQIFRGSGSFWSQLIPHPDVGFTADFDGKTSNLYGGLAWNFELTRRIFLSSEFGLGVNNGKTGAPPPGFNGVGCNWWFHESESAGYRLTSAWSVMATVEHSSNAGFCAKNRGLTNFGLRVGYRF